MSQLKKVLVYIDDKEYEIFLGKEKQEITQGTIDVVPEAVRSLLTKALHGEL